ncbi:MAG TPA: DUF2383 domain-containing protein [Chloroflexia bacterium]|nr:DUF2383 domain-containing protein [Chloroflexia bacterium]
MSDKELEKTQKAIGELVKVEYMAIAAYDEAIGETEDSRLHRQYSRFRGDHEKQARALNNRLAELGGAPVEYGSGSAKAGLWGKITGLFGDAASISGMVKGAEDGIRIYLDHLDEIHDSKTLGIVRRNLEAKQQEVRWLEEQAQQAKADTGATLQQTARDLGKKSAKVAQDVQAKVEDAVQPKAKRTGFLGLPVWLLLAAAAGAAFFFLRRQEEPDFSDEAFQYETADFGTTGEPSGTTGEGYHGITESGNGQHAGSDHQSGEQGSHGA